MELVFVTNRLVVSIFIIYLPMMPSARQSSKLVPVDAVCCFLVHANQLKTQQSQPRPSNSGAGSPSGPGRGSNPLTTTIENQGHT